MSTVLVMLVTAVIIAGYAVMGALFGGYHFQEARRKGATDEAAYGSAAVVATLWPMYVLIFFILGPPIMAIWRSGMAIHTRIKRQPLPKAEVIR